MIEIVSENNYNEVYSFYNDINHLTLYINENNYMCKKNYFKLRFFAEVINLTIMKCEKLYFSD